MTKEKLLEIKNGSPRLKYMQSDGDVIRVDEVDHILDLALKGLSAEKLVGALRHYEDFGSGQTIARDAIEQFERECGQ